MAATRMAWPDVAKGVSIIGVVLLHVSLAVPEGMETALARLNTLLDPLRMPLFFLVSGLFSLKVLKFSFGDLVLRRLWFFAVPYVIWVPVELWLKSHEYQMTFGTEPRPFLGYVWHVVTGTNMAWFLYALILFNLVLWLTRKLPSWAAITLSFAPLLALPMHDEWDMAGKAMLYLPFFMAGARLRSVITRFAETSLRPSRFVFATAAYLVGVGILLGWSRFIATGGSEFSVQWPLLGGTEIGSPEARLVANLLVQVVMIPIAIVGVVLLSKVPYLSAGLQTLGRNTMPIYLGHPLAITVMYHYLQVQLQIPITRDADVIWHSTHFWMLYALAMSFAAGLLLKVIQDIPYLGWTLAPPRLPIPAWASNKPTTRGTKEIAVRKVRSNAHHGDPPAT